MARKSEYSQGFSDLKQAIRNKTPGNLYIFFGEEVFLLRYYLQQMKRILLDELTESFNYHHFNGETYDLQYIGFSISDEHFSSTRSYCQANLL